MMQNKIYFLLVIFLVIIAQVISSDSSSRKSSKNRADIDDDDSIVSFNTNNKKKQDRFDGDDRLQSLTDRRNRISSSSDNHRSRSRWPSTHDKDDRHSSHEWSPYKYGLNNIMSNFPMALPPSVYEGGPSCYPLLDPQYPIFADLCGAVPQARYALPNAFGHIERWQIAQALTTILSPASANPVCARSLRLLVCPLLFPPCPTRYEAPPVLPCQPFCRVVKTQCAAPGLELLPCDLLPPTSDLCPINPTPYSSLLSSFVPPLPLAGPLPPTGLPPSSLSSLLAQSAFASGLSPMDMPPFASMMSQSPYTQTLTPGGFISPPPLSSPSSPIGKAASSVTSSSLPSSSGIPTPNPAINNFPSFLSSPGMPSLGTGSPALASFLSSSGMPSLGTDSPALASFLSSSGMPSLGAGSPALASFLSSSGPNSPGLASLLSSSGPNSPGLASLLAASNMPSPSMLSPMNPFFIQEPFMNDMFSPSILDFPYPPGLAHASRFFPSLRSGTEEV